MYITQVTQLKTIIETGHYHYQIQIYLAHLPNEYKIRKYNLTFIVKI